MAPGNRTREGLGYELMDLRDAADGPPLDAAIIGGGINGAGIARQAAMAGLRVALFEARDFGFGTTWRSTKLIHGGLRYLEHGDIGLVFEALRERKWLLRTRPHLVHPQRLLFPMLPWTRRPAWQVRAGLFAYDVLALRGGVPRHRWLREEAMRNRAPFLPPDHRGGFSFFDARARSPERLTLELACEARDAGALVLNHARVTDIMVRGGAVSGVRVAYGEHEYEVPVLAVINAAGPWVDIVNRTAEVEGPDLLGVTRGSHIVVDVEYPIRDAIFSTAESDGRVFFAVPQDGLLLVGTTDVRFGGEPGDVRPTLQEVEYMLAEARALMPGLDIDAAHVRYAYAGLRPLQRDPGGPEAAITRRHQVIRHEKSGGPAGLYSVIGGKLSTFRPLSREVISILGGDSVRNGDQSPDTSWREKLSALEVDRLSRLRLRNYGPALNTMLDSTPDWISTEPQILRAEIENAVHNEMAVTLEDVMLRRTGLGWNRNRGLDSHRAVARAMARILGWDERQVEDQVHGYEQAVRYHLPTMEDLQGDDGRTGTGH